jgi:hypothetical protein
MLLTCPRFVYQSECEFQGSFLLLFFSPGRLGGGEPPPLLTAPDLLVDLWVLLLSAFSTVFIFSEITASFCKIGLFV